MALLDNNIREQVREVFRELVHPVHILLFTADKQSCEYCEDTQQLLSEVVELVPDKLSLEVKDLERDQELARRYHIDKAPGFAILAKQGSDVNDYGIRYFGIPAGHEFTSLINDIINVSRQDSGLSDETRKALKGLKTPVTMQVFVTPSCPYCPRAVILAHQMAIESQQIEAEMVEALEFSELANEYGVSGVPHTVIKAKLPNGGEGFEEVVGAVPEKHLLTAVLSAAGMA